MKISVRVKPNAKEEKVKKINETYFEICVKEPPIKGKANKAIIRVLADYFDISPSRINIISGFKSKEKILEIKHN
ncbi:MAG: DUF167 domain-containing protein [Candidatus Nealsonbacteria bacterium]|nr:DUF167 domain-containing protein [Candidatus Nealsonbacteria bacterium]